MVPGTDSSVIYIRKNCWFHNQTKIIEYKLALLKSPFYHTFGIVIITHI